MNVLGKELSEDFEVELETILGSNLRPETIRKPGIVSNTPESEAEFSAGDQN